MSKEEISFENHFTDTIDEDKSYEKLDSNIFSEEEVESSVQEHFKDVIEEQKNKGVENEKVYKQMVIKPKDETPNTNQPEPENTNKPPQDQKKIYFDSATNKVLEPVVDIHTGKVITPKLSFEDQIQAAVDEEDDEYEYVVEEEIVDVINNEYDENSAFLANEYQAQHELMNSFNSKPQPQPQRGGVSNYDLRNNVTKEFFAIEKDNYFNKQFYNKSQPQDQHYDDQQYYGAQQYYDDQQYYDQQYYDDQQQYYDQQYYDDQQQYYDDQQQYYNNQQPQQHQNLQNLHAQHYHPQNSTPMPNKYQQKQPVQQQQNHVQPQQYNHQPQPQQQHVQPQQQHVQSQQYNQQQLQEQQLQQLQLQRQQRELQYQQQLQKQQQNHVEDHVKRQQNYIQQQHIKELQERIEQLQNQQPNQHDYEKDYQDNQVHVLLRDQINKLQNRNDELELELSSLRSMQRRFFNKDTNENQQSQFLKQQSQLLNQQTFNPPAPSDDKCGNFTQTPYDMSTLKGSNIYDSLFTDDKWGTFVKTTPSDKNTWKGSSNSYDSIFTDNRIRSFDTSGTSGKDDGHDEKQNTHTTPTKCPFLGYMEKHHSFPSEKKEKVHTPDPQPSNANANTNTNTNARPYDKFFDMKYVTKTHHDTTSDDRKNSGFSGCPYGERSTCPGKPCPIYDFAKVCPYDGGSKSGVYFSSPMCFQI